MSNDKQSIDNGIITHNTPYRPVLIDPQMQATMWLKRINVDNSSFLSVKCFQDTLIKSIEDAITNGKAILVEECEDSFPKALTPLITNDIIYEKSKPFFKFADKMLEVAPGFKLYLATKLDNPQYVPFYYLHCTFVNFIIT